MTLFIWHLCSTNCNWITIKILFLFLFFLTCPQAWSDNQNVLSILVLKLQHFFFLYIWENKNSIFPPFNPIYFIFHWKIDYLVNGGIHGKPSMFSCLVVGVGRAFLLLLLTPTPERGWRTVMQKPNCAELCLFSIANPDVWKESDCLPSWGKSGVPRCSARSPASQCSFSWCPLKTFLAGKMKAIWMA